MSGFIVIRNGEDGVNIEMKVMYNSSTATEEVLQKAVVAVLPQAYMEIEKRMAPRG